MKRYISIFIAALCVILASHAESISVANITIETGNAATVGINLTNTATNLVSFQMDLKLPDGISINKAGCTLSSRFTDSDQELTIGRLSDGSYRMTSTSFSLIPINGTSGTIITLSLSASMSAIGGTATLSKICFVTSNSEKVTVADASFNITVGVKATGISLNAANLTFTSVGQVSTLTATVTPSNATNNNVTWSSSNTAVATVSSSGIVTAVANGTTVITAMTEDGTNLTATCTVTVNIPVLATGITLSKSTLTLTSAGQTSTLTATVTPSDANNKGVTWTSSDESVATVSSSGVVTAVANGTTTITATTKDGTSLTATCTVTVSISSAITFVTFADANVKTLCMAHWDTDSDGELSMTEAAAVTSLGQVFKGNTNITSFNELQYFTGLTSIDESAFEDCSGLTSVTFPAGLQTIGMYAFKNSGLESVSFPSTLTLVEGEAFKNCQNLASIDFGGCSATLNYMAFSGCSTLETLNVPSSIVLSGWHEFSYCTGLRTATIEATATGDGITALLEGCTALETVVLSSLNLINECSLENCTSLRSVTFQSSAGLSGWKSHAKSFKGVPSDCLFIIPEGTAVDFLQREYANLSDLSGLSLVREEFEAEAARITTMANALADGDKTTLTTAISEARTAVNSAEDYLTVYAQIAAIKTAAKAFLATATITANFDVTAAMITNPDLERFAIGWDILRGRHTRGYNPQVYSNNGVRISHFVEAWAGAGATLDSGKIFQTITNLSAGVYRLEADLIATYQNDANVEVTGVNLFAGSSTTVVATGNEKPQHFTVEFTQYMQGDCAIGVDINNTTANWVAMDNVKLYRLRNAPDPMTFEDVAYYIQNVETGLYLNQGNDWGTHAVLKEEGLAVKVTQLPDGSYTIYFLEGSGEEHLLFRDDVANVYVNYNSTQSSQCPYWTITPAGEEGTCHIQSLITDDRYGQHIYPGTYLGNNPTKEAYNRGVALGVYNDVDGNIPDEDGMNITWRLVKVIPDGPEPDTDVSQLDNVIYIERVEANVGQTVTLSVKMKNTVGIQTVQFDLYLPDGVTVAKDEDDFELIELSTERTTVRKMDSFSFSKIANGVYRVLINSNNGYTFDGNDGEIAKVTVNIPLDMEEGDYSIIIKNILLVNTSSEGYETAYVKSTLNISAYMPGDVNNDGKINAIDLNAIVNYILERRTFSFAFLEKAADLNNDNKINAIDVNIVTKMILRGTTQQNVKARIPICVGVLEE